MQLKLNEMTLEQKLGFVMCVRGLPLQGTPEYKEGVAFLLEQIRKRAVGCVQVRVGDTELMDLIRKTADYPILLINDMEEGFPVSDRPKTQNLTLGACSDMESIRAFTRGIVHDAQEAGFNGAWSPVVDILQNPSKPGFASRCFAGDRGTVTDCAETMIRIMEENHFLSTAKHYPGSGGGDPVDTHMEKDVNPKSREELENTELQPYFRLMEKGLLRAVMVGHTTYTGVDPVYPASLSKKVIDLIRDRGFDGIVFSDSFAMMGILQHFGEENIYGMALAAGNDIILPNYNIPHAEAMRMFEKNFRDGAFTMEQLDTAVRRVLEAQAFVAGQEGICPCDEKDTEKINNLSKDCITAVVDPGTSVALDDPEGRKLFVILTEMNHKPDENTQEITTGKWYYPTNLANKIRDTFPNSEVFFLKEFPDPGQISRMLVKAVPHHEIVLVTFCTTTAYCGTDCMTRRAESALNSLISSGKVSALVHFGNPSAVQPLRHVPRRIFGYMMTDSQAHAMDALAGKFQPTGKLPFPVDLA